MFDEHEVCVEDAGQFFSVAWIEGIFGAISFRLDHCRTVVAPVHHQHALREASEFRVAPVERLGDGAERLLGVEVRSQQ